jgi:hypothetical protein
MQRLRHSRDGTTHGQPFLLLDLETPQFKALEAFLITVYGEGADSINGLRKQIFIHKNQNPEMMPMTQNAYLQHCRRAAYQASIWACAHKSEIKAPDPAAHGWRKEDQRLLPVWMTIPLVSKACQEMIKCGCKKPCAKACSCKKKSLNCTDLCKCACSKN